MRRRKYKQALKYLAVAVIAAAATAFFFRYQAAKGTMPPSLERPQAEKKQTGYKEEDRQRLERLIHEGGKDD